MLRVKGAYGKAMFRWKCYITQENKKHVFTEWCYYVVSKAPPSLPEINKTS